MMEEQMRRAMMINFGDVTIFITRPLSAAFLIAAASMMLLIALPSLRAKREVALQE
jgi:TctA family transporter